MYSWCTFKGSLYVKKNKLIWEQSSFCLQNKNDFRPWIVNPGLTVWTVEKLSCQMYYNNMHLYTCMSQCSILCSKYKCIWLTSIANQTSLYLYEWVSCVNVLYGRHHNLFLAFNRYSCSAETADWPKVKTIQTNDLPFPNNLTNSVHYTRGPQALTVTWASETLHWILVSRAHICISAPLLL